MNEWKLILKNILEAIKLPKKFIFWLFLLSGILLILIFKKNEWLIALGIDTILMEYKAYLVLFFIGSGILLLVECSIFFWTKSKKIFSRKYRIRKITKKLISLSSEEKAVLREFFLNQKGSIRLPINDRAVKNLVRSNEIIKNSYDYGGEMSAVGNLYLMSISEEAEPLIIPELINWPTDKDRPWFMEVIEKTRNRNSWMAL